MQDAFVIPTYRIRDAARTVADYSASFLRHGRDIPIMVFDDSKPDVGQAERERLRGIKHPSGIFYIGPAEKASYLEHLAEKTKIDQQLLERMFPPSYGGNRNFTLVHTLGDHFISADDDMRPQALVEGGEPLGDGEVCKGRYVDRTDHYDTISQDIVGAFRAVLGKRSGEVDLPKGEGIADSMMDYYTNTTKGAFGQSTLYLLSGAPKPEAKITIAQTFRTGSTDVDAKDYANDFLVDPVTLSKNDMRQVFVISGKRPCITNTNWRVDCGVAGYDNTDGLPPFIPTELRFEDYLYRLFSNHPDIATAHVDAIQDHHRSPYRSPIPHDYHNEALANHMKVQLRKHMTGVGTHGVTFGGEIAMDRESAGALVNDAYSLYLRAIGRAEESSPRLQGYFINFANDLCTVYKRFDVDAFWKDAYSRISKEFALLQDTIKVWPTILEASQKLEKPKERMA